MVRIVLGLLVGTFILCCAGGFLALGSYALIIRGTYPWTDMPIIFVLLVLTTLAGLLLVINSITLLWKR